MIKSVLSNRIAYTDIITNYSISIKDEHRWLVDQNENRMVVLFSTRGGKKENGNIVT